MGSVSMLYSAGISTEVRVFEENRIGGSDSIQSRESKVAKKERGDQALVLSWLLG